MSSHSIHRLFIIVARIALFFGISVAVLLLLASCNAKTSGLATDNATDVADSDTAPQDSSTLPLDTGYGDPNDTRTFSKRTLAEQVFNQDELKEYHITIDEDVYSDLQAHGVDKVYRPASLRVVAKAGESLFESIGLRYKGAWTLSHCWNDFGGVRSHAGECAKLSLRISFKRYDDQQRFHGLKNLNLHALSADASKMRDSLSYGIFNEFGIDAPLTAHAKLFINGRYEGLVLAVEQIDGRYTKAHYAKGGDGNLYKEIWPVADLSPDHVRSALKTNEEVGDVSDFIAFGNQVAQATAATFSADMADWTDIGALVRYMAVDRALQNWDGITAFYSPRTPHNFYWYHDDGPIDMFHLVPWDLDNTFPPFDPFMNPQQWVTAAPIPNWNVKPADCTPMSVWTANDPTRVTPPGCDNLIHLLAHNHWDDFAAAGQELLDTIFVYDALNAKVTRWAELVAPAIADDPYVNTQEWERRVDELRGILQDAIFDFEQHLLEGYIEQSHWDEPDADALNAPTDETGLRRDIIHNYEFIDGAADTAPIWTYDYASSGTTTVTTWSTADPLSGLADLRMEVDYTRIPGAWNEVAGVAVEVDGGGTIDVSKMVEMSVTLRADRERNLRIDFRSPVYSALYGGIWEVFSRDIIVTSAPTTFKITLGSISYPDWAKAEWAGAQGWTGSDAAARAEVLSRLSAVVFELYPQRSNDGEMIAETEHATLQIDNIYFRF